MRDAALNTSIDRWYYFDQLLQKMRSTVADVSL